MFASWLPFFARGPDLVRASRSAYKITLNKTNARERLLPYQSEEKVTITLRENQRQCKWKKEERSALLSSKRYRRSPSLPIPRNLIFSCPTPATYFLSLFSSTRKYKNNACLPLLIPETYLLFYSNENKLFKSPFVRSNENSVNCKTFRIFRDELPECDLVAKSSVLHARTPHKSLVLDIVQNNWTQKKKF